MTNAQKTSAPLFDLLFEESSVGRCLVAPDGSVLRVNAEWLRSTGYSGHQVLGNNILDLSPGTRDLHARARAGHRVEVPRHARMVDRRETWWNGSIDPVPMEGGTGLLITARELANGTWDPGSQGVASVATDWLIGRGEMVDLIRARDWTSTPFGARERWPQSLRTVVNLVVESKFAMALLWGRDLLFVYNDAYRELAAHKHPQALGRSIREIWPEMWHFDEPIFSAVMDRGETVYLENQLFRVDRKGVLEEAYFTLSYGPVRAEDGHVSGTLVTLLETTDRRRSEEALRESEERLRTLGDNLPAGALYRYERDGDGRPRFLFVSKGIEALHGVPPAEILRDAGALLSTVHPEDRARLASQDAHSRDTLEVFEMEVRVRHRLTGEERWHLLRSVPSRQPDGRTIWDCIQVDVTERKRAEEALRDREERGRRLVEQVPDGIFVASPEGRYTDVNPAGCAMLGMTREEVLARTFLDVLAPEEHGRLADATTTLMDGKVHHSEWRFRRADGTSFVGELNGRRLPDGSFQGVLRDVTERDRAEQRFRASQERLALAVRSTRAGVWDWDIVRNEMLWDDGMFAIYGADRERVAGSIDDWKSALHPEDGGRAIAECEAALAGVREFDTEFRIRRSDGTVAHLKADGLVLRDSSGAPVRMIGLNRDITANKRAEEALRRSEDQLRQSQKLESIGQLAGGIAHDFNNLLTVILSGTDSLKRAIAEGRPGDLEDASEAHHAAQRARELTGQLLAFARKQTSLVVLVDLGAAISSIQALLRRVLGDEVELVTDVEPGLWQVKFDPGQLEQVFMNLALNARDAMPSGGTLRIEARNAVVHESVEALRGGDRPGEWVRLSISDTGVGMSPETLGRLFEPFFTTKDVGKGTGLGLAMVHGLVNLGGGHIHVESKVGKGSVFEVCLPRARGEVHAVRPDRNASGGPGPQGSEQVLVVEDQPGVRKVIVRTLRRAGYRVVEQGHPNEALEFFRETHDSIHLVVSDVRMPGRSGPSMVEEMRRIRPGLRALFVSGHSGSDAERATAGDGFLGKPFTGDQLLTKVREAIMGADRV